MKERKFNLDLLIYHNNVVNCKTEDEAKAFLDFLEKENIRWCSGKRIYSNNLYNYKDYGADTCFCLRYEGLLQYSPINYYAVYGFKILSLECMVKGT